MNSPVTLQRDQQFKSIRTRLGIHGLRKFQNLHGEIGAGRQVRPLRRSLLNLDAGYLSASLRPEMQHIKSLADMQSPMRTIGLPPVIVEDPVGNVGLFLHFAQEHAGPNCVRASCRNEEGVPGLHGEPREALLDVTIRQGLTESFRGHTRLQAQTKLGIGLGSHRIPHFCFAYSSRRGFVLTGVFVVRMNLHRELFLREDELYKQRNARARLQQASFPFDGKSGPAFAERTSRQGTRGKGTRVSGKPDLTDGFASRRIIE